MIESSKRFIIWDVDGTLLDTEPLSRKIMQRIVDETRKDAGMMSEYIIVI